MAYVNPGNRPLYWVAPTMKVAIAAAQYRYPVPKRVGAERTVTATTIAEA